MSQLCQRSIICFKSESGQRLHFLASSTLTSDFLDEYVSLFKCTLPLMYFAFEKGCEPMWLVGSDVDVIVRDAFT